MGWTNDLTAAEKLANEIASCRQFVAENPNNEYWRMRLECVLARQYAEEQAAANFRAGAEYLARLEAEQQRLELAAEADWLDARNTQESLLAWMR